ncbi:MAG: T9SS type A sorting domain-containing protein [Bacteroidota bacterium]
MSLFKRLAYSLCLLVAPTLPISTLAQSIPTFQEADGLVVIEAESAPSYGDWEIDTTIQGFSGDSYLHYKGNNLFNDPGFSKLEFKVAIVKPGKYRFQWRSRIAQGTSNTEHNDSWLRMNDASDFYAEKGNVRVYPKGTGKTPNPNGSSSRGWFKVYQNNRGAWSWQTRTSDHDPHDIYVEFDTAGVYSLEIAGRSKGHAIDRLVLFHSDLSSVFATSSARPESERVQTVSIRAIPFQPLTIWPTLADDRLYIKLPALSANSQRGGIIINSFGQKLSSFTFSNNTTGELALPVDQLGKGIYFVQLRVDKVLFRGKFIKS